MKLFYLSRNFTLKLVKGGKSLTSNTDLNPKNNEYALPPFGKMQEHTLLSDKANCCRYWKTRLHLTHTICILSSTEQLQSAFKVSEIKTGLCGKGCNCQAQLSLQKTCIFSVEDHSYMVTFCFNSIIKTNGPEKSEVYFPEGGGQDLQEQCEIEPLCMSAIWFILVLLDTKRGNVQHTTMESFPTIRNPAAFQLMLSHQHFPQVCKTYHPKS